MPDIEELKKRVFLYKAYLSEAATDFSFKVPEQVIEEGKVRNVPANDPLYHPEIFFNEQIEKGAFMPILLYNEIFLKECPAPPLLEEKLKNWALMTEEYQGSLRNPKVFMEGYNTQGYPSYKQWRTENDLDPAFHHLSENQTRAIYCTELFKWKHLKYVEDAPLLGAIGNIQTGEKFLADCDIMTYTCLGLMLEATDADGKKLFDPKNIKLEKLPKHLRMRIEIPEQEAIIFEATSKRYNAQGQTRTEANLSGEFKGFTCASATPYTIAEGLGLAMDVDHASKNTKHVVAFRRALCLIGDKNPTMVNNLDATISSLAAGCYPNFLEDGLFEIEADLKKLPGRFLNNRSLNQYLKSRGFEGNEISIPPRASIDEKNRSELERLAKRIYDLSHPQAQPSVNHERSTLDNHRHPEASGASSDEDKAQTQDQPFHGLNLSGVGLNATLSTSDSTSSSGAPLLKSKPPSKVKLPPH